MAIQRVTTVSADFEENTITVKSCGELVVQKNSVLVGQEEWFIIKTNLFLLFKFAKNNSKLLHPTDVNGLIGFEKFVQKLEGFEDNL